MVQAVRRVTREAERMEYIGGGINGMDREMRGIEEVIKKKIENCKDEENKRKLQIIVNNQTKLQEMTEKLEYIQSLITKKNKILQEV